MPQPRKASKKIKTAKAHKIIVEKTAKKKPASVSSASTYNIAAQIKRGKHGDVQNIDQASYLPCQQLINRVYRKAYDHGCLVTEIYQLLCSYSQHKYSTVNAFTSEINKTIFAEMTKNDKAGAIFEYTNEQIITLGLDLIADQRILKSQCEDSKAKREHAESK